MISSYLKKHAIFFLFISIYFFILFYKLVAHPTPFYDWDESLYIQSGQEMFAKHYFLFPVWQGTPWIDKPPLIPFLYALVSKIAFFTTAEVSTRVFTLLISVVVLSMVYALYKRVLKKSSLTILAVAICAFTPIFLQRAQVVNLDIFLLLGWLGYIIFYERFGLSLFFLFIAVFSKSLIGFYAPAMIVFYYFYLWMQKKLSTIELKQQMKKIMMQVGILSLWYVVMLLLFGATFWKQHIIESHFRRITSSIEFHFGQRTFYIDLAREQLGLLFWVSLAGLGGVIHRYFKKEKEFFYSLFLLPWFIFLNLTKTKIFWYFYAAIPQFSFLSAYPVAYFAKNKLVRNAIFLIIAGVFIYQSFIKQNVLATVYSRKEPHYYLALYAKDSCDSLHILLDKQTRDSFATLEKLGLLITTTKWWGSHPSMVYYFRKPIEFVYNRDEFIESSLRTKKNECVVIDSMDRDLAPSKASFDSLNTFGSMKLFVRK